MTNPDIKQIDISPPESGELIEVATGIYWLRMPLPMALNHINLYLIDEGDSWSLIDTGMCTDATKEIWIKHFSTSFKNKPIKQIFVTHMHPDHVGLAGWLSDKFKCPIFMTQAEYFATRAYCAKLEMDWQVERYIRAAGLGDDYVDYMRDRIGFSSYVSPMPSSFEQLKNGASIRIGGKDWQVIVGGGHTFAHAAFYQEGEKWLLAGDQILPKISPNVSVMATEPAASPLHDWYDSLHALKRLSSDTLIFPAHNKPFTGLHQRADELIEHHEQQLRLLMHECQSPKRPVDLLLALFGREIKFGEMGLAIGECKAHLRMLLDRGLMTFEIIEGVEYYQSLSDPGEIEISERAEPLQV